MTSNSTNQPRDRPIYLPLDAENLPEPHDVVSVWFATEGGPVTVDTTGSALWAVMEAGNEADVWWRMR